MLKFPSKIKRGLTKSLIYILMSTPIIYNCTKDEFEDLEIIEPDIVLSENVKILSESELESITKIDSLGNITFEEAQNYSKGDILVAGISNETPGGLLKKIENISSDRKTVSTINAPLDEAIKKGEFSFSKNLEINDFSDIKMVQGIKQLENDFAYEFNEVIIDLDGNLSTTEDQIKINGKISFDINTNIDIEFNWGNINFLFETQINEESSLEAIANMNLIDFDKEILVFSAPGIPFQIPAPIPLVVRPEFKLYVGAKGKVDAEASTKLENYFDFNGGIYYQDKEWSSKKDFSNEFIFYEPEVSIKGELIAYCKPQLNLIVNEVAGPSAGVRGYLEMKIDNQENPWWELYGGLDVILGISSGWLTSSFGDYEKTILEFKEKVTDSGGLNNLEAKLIASSEEGFAPLDVLFDASSSSGDIKEYYFEFGNGDEHLERIGETDFDGKVEYVYENFGNYNSKVTVKDISGKTDSKSLEILVKENNEIILKHHDGLEDFSFSWPGYCLDYFERQTRYMWITYENPCEELILEGLKIKFEKRPSNNSLLKLYLGIINETGSYSNKFNHDYVASEINEGEWTQFELPKIKITEKIIKVYIQESEKTLPENCQNDLDICGWKITIDKDNKGYSQTKYYNTDYDGHQTSETTLLEGEYLIELKGTKID